VLPLLAADARDQIILIVDQAERAGQEIALQDGFDLYKEMMEIRSVYQQALPRFVFSTMKIQHVSNLFHSSQFSFDIEGLLAAFVWRLIRMTDDRTIPWVEEAVKQDRFVVEGSSTDESRTDDQKHSVSVVDIFRSFNQAVNQISQLDWKDDLQYSKFMTALSRAFGAGVAKYCELLEQMFIKEMDQLSPEQEMALTQSKQEKWMQMAKEAISTKEKVEPFQFFPQVIVTVAELMKSTS